MTTWEEKQLKQAVINAKQKAGSAWSMVLGAELRRALVRAEVLSILAAAASVEDTPQGRLASLACQWGED
jgi:hypothetical protein